MGYPYISGPPLDPDDEWDCPFCGHISATQAGLMLHVSRCPKNDEIDYPDDDPGEAL